MPDRNDKAQVIGQEDKGPDYVPSQPTAGEAVKAVDPATAAILQEQGKDPVKDQDSLEPPTTVQNAYGGKVPLEGYTNPDPKAAYEREHKGKKVEEKPVPPTATSKLRNKKK